MTRLDRDGRDPADHQVYEQQADEEDQGKQHAAGRAAFEMTAEFVLGEGKDTATVGAWRIIFGTGRR